MFQVKKSSQSKKIRKLLDKERKKKKDGKSESSDTTNSSHNKSSEITIGDEITIKIKNNLVSPEVYLYSVISNLQSQILHHIFLILVNGRCINCHSFFSTRSNLYNLCYVVIPPQSK